MTVTPEAAFRWDDPLEFDALLSDEERAKLLKELRKSFQADIDDTEAYIEDAAERMRQVWELFKTMGPKQIEHDETIFRELKERFGSPYGFGEYFRGGMGAEAIRDLLAQVELDADRDPTGDQPSAGAQPKASHAGDPDGDRPHDQVVAAMYANCIDRAAGWLSLRRLGCAGCYRTAACRI